MARIYISSTYSDLKDYREIVYHTLRQLRHDVIAMEDDVAADARPVEKCLKDVASCDLYIGIFAFRYGFIPEEHNPEHLSITELEYRKAGDSGVTRLVFLVKDGAAWSTALMDALADEEAGRRIAALRSELKKAHVDSFFESGEELARLASVAVQRALEVRPAERVQIDWDAPRRRLVDHMRRFAGARSEYNALSRYFPLTLQATKVPETGSARARRTELPVGTWNELVTYPGKVLLTGESGSGKTTLLLYEAQRLAIAGRDDAATPLPLYLSLRAFAGGDANTLLEMAADENRIDAQALRALWAEPRRPVCLLLDGGDETAYREELIDAIIELAHVFTAAAGAGSPVPPEVRSLIVSCHPGPLQERMVAFDASWREYLLMPLRNAAIDAMLTRFDAASLIPFLDERLRQTIRRPDLLSALAQSARDRPVELLPRNAAEIYGLYLAHLFNTLDGQYDYERIKRPVIAHIAYDMVRTRQAAVACDDPLYESMASDLATLHLRYHRRRQVMPHDWSAEALHNELVRSPVVDLAAGRGERLMFSKTLYRDYFVAVYLQMVGIASQEARELIAGLTDGEQLQPLSFLLGMVPASATLFDALPDSALSAAAQIWLEDRAADTPVPISIRNAFQKRCAVIQANEFDFSEAAAGGTKATGSAANPRQRFDEVSRLARQSPLPALRLLEAADDDHPLVRAVAEHALLHACDPYASLAVDVGNGSFRWRSYGAGVARIGPLQLLRVPVPMMLDLRVEIGRLDVDPFDVDAEFSFLPMSPALFAANLFADRSVDWLELLARIREIAAASEGLARRAGSRPRLGGLARELGRRAVSYASVGSLLAADLGLPFENVEPIAASDGHDAAAAVTYQHLRLLFSRANQSHTLRLTHVANDPVVDVRLDVGRVEAGGTAVGLRVERLERSGPDDTADTTHTFTLINSSRRVQAVHGGTVQGIRIGRVRGFSRELPLDVHINDSVEIGDVLGGEVGGILIDTLESAACPLRVNAAIRIARFTGSRLFGVSVGAYEPRLEG